MARTPTAEPAASLAIPMPGARKSSGYLLTSVHVTLPILSHIAPISWSGEYVKRVVLYLTTLIPSQKPSLNTCEPWGEGLSPKTLPSHIPSVQS